MSERQGALSNLRVIDLTQMLAGPFGTQMLADHGAEVIKVESLEGDMSRAAGPFLADDEQRAFGGYFQSTNRNKASIAIDLKHPMGREILLDLVRGADVLVENFRAGVMERLNLSYETLRAVNPRLVYGALRGFGDARSGASPYGEWPAFDVVAQAMGGIMGITGPDAQTPMKVGPGVGDIVPGMYLAFGIMAAVHHANRTGQGQFLDVAMTDSILAVCERIVHQYSYGGSIAHPEGNQHPLLCPFGLFPARDSWVAIACPVDHFWRILCEEMGRPELASDPCYASNASRLAHRAEVVALITAFTSRHTVAELTERLGGRIAFGPVFTAQDIMQDPHFAARGMLATVEHPGSATPVQVVGVPVKLSATPGRVYRRAPLLGEQTDELLRSLCLSEQEIAGLREQGIVR